MRAATAPEDPAAVPPGSWAWGLLAAIVVATALIRLRLLDLPLDRDEGEYAYFGQLLLRGIPPYEAAYNQKLPGIYGVYAAILAVFGETPRGIHLGLLVTNAATIVATFLLAARLFTTTAGLVAGATCAALSLSPRLFVPSAYAEHFVLLAALPGTLLFLRALDTRRTVDFFASGLLLGTALLIKQSGGPFAAFAAVYLLLDARREPVAAWAPRLAALVAGAVLPLGAAGLALLLTGAFSNFWFWTMTYGYFYATAIAPTDGAIYLARALRTIVATSYLVFGLAALGLVALVWDREARARRAFVGLFALFSFVAVSLGLYFRNQYFILLLPSLALFAGIAVDALGRLLARTRAAALHRALPGALAALALLHLVYLERAILFQATPLQVMRALYGRNPFPEAVEVARYVRERTAREDRVAVIGSEPEIYFYAGRPGATGYIYMYPLTELHPYASAMQQHMIRQVEAANPKFVVFVSVPSSWSARPESDKTVFFWFEHYQKNFDRVGVVDILSTQRTHYAWGPEAALYTPRSDAWLMVFQRREPARPTTP